MLFNVEERKIRVAAVRSGCEACSLSDQWRRLDSPKMEPTGSTGRDVDVYFLAEAPNARDDQSGVPLHDSSSAGRLFRGVVEDWKISWRLGYMARCKCPEGRQPKPSEVSACWDAFGLADLIAHRPRVVVPMGKIALARFAPGQIDEWAGVRAPVKFGGHTAWLLPAQDPEAVVTSKSREADELKEIWRRIVRMIPEQLDSWGTPRVVTREEALEGIRPILPNELEQMSELPISGRTLGVDIECTELMPQADGAALLSVALSNGKETIAFLVEHPDNPNPAHARELLIKKLQSTPRLVAHHAATELRWFLARFGLNALRWYWCDSMARPYAEFGVLRGRGNDDEQDSARARLASLGKQTTQHFGFNVKEILDVDPLKWRGYPVDKFLTYNGLDAKWCLKAWQQPLPQFAWAEVNRQRDAIRGFTAVGWQGMLVDEVELGEQSKALEQEVARREIQIKQNAKVIRFEQQRKLMFKPSAPDQIADLFGLPSADEEALREVDDPLAKLILEYRKYEKMLGTYVGGVKQGLYPDGRLHPDYTTMLTATGRGSARNPNTQNFPTRQDKKFRRVIVAPPGYAIVAFDFKQLEAGMVGCASGDLVFLGYIWRGDDIHKEWAVEVLDVWPDIADRLCPHLKEDREILARVRGEMKNGFTFPQIYGAGVPKCARVLVMPEDLLGPIVDKFWDKYSAIKRWQTAQHKFYRDNLYVETLTERRRFAPVSWNEQLNSPIQGTGADLVTDAQIRCVEHALETNDPCFIPMVNIHDDLSFYFPLDRVQQYAETVARIMCTPTFPWIKIPLAVEVSVGKANWSEKHELRTYSTRDFFDLPANDVGAQAAAVGAIGRRNWRYAPIDARAITAAAELRDSGPASSTAARRARLKLPRSS